MEADVVSGVPELPVGLTSGRDRQTHPVLE